MTDLERPIDRSLRLALKGTTDILRLNRLLPLEPPGMAALRRFMALQDLIDRTRWPWR